MGRVIDERHRPVEFANVALLNPRDSSFLTGGVTNASGYELPLLHSMSPDENG